MGAGAVLYYTDPACPWSWAAEPALLRLRDALGEQTPIELCLTGLAPSFPSPLHPLGEWLEATARSAMPLDARLWTGVPPRSSHPACLAVKAAGEQGLGWPLLRRLREGFALERRRQDSAEALLEVGRDVAELDLTRLASALGSTAIIEAFAADLERAGGRRGPALQIRGELLEGPSLLDPDAPLAAAVRAGLAGELAPSEPEQLVLARGRLATAEVAARCAPPGPRAPAELWRLASEWPLRPERWAAGETWTAP